MKQVLHILTVLLLVAGLAAALNGLRGYAGSCPTSPGVNEELANNDDAFDDYHDTFNIEELANNDDAFDDYHDTFNIEELV